MKKLIIALSVLLVAIVGMPSAFAQNAALPSGELNADFSSWGKPSVEGSWEIVREGEKTYIQLGENFRAKKGPDVKIFLSPTPASQVTGSNAVDGSVFIKLIEDFDGKARIEIPAGVDINQYQSLVFHCEEYSKLWGTSSL